MKFIKINFKLLPSLNRIVRTCILGDIFLWSGWGLLDPIFAIFIVQNAKGATLVSVGILSMIYWIVKGLLQIPVSLYLDKTEGEKDDFYAMLSGLLIASIASFGLLMVQTIHQAYFVQFIKAVGFSLYVPSWSAIFSRHLDKNHTAFDWAISSSSASLGLGLAGAIGGTIASLFGFRVVFLVTGLMGLIGAWVMLFVPNLILPRRTTGESKMRDHRIQV